MTEAQDLLRQLDVAIAANLSPADRAVYLANADRLREKEANHGNAIRELCIGAIEDIATVLRYPRISAEYLEDAIKKLQSSLNYARELDQ